MSAGVKAWSTSMTSRSIVPPKPVVPTRNDGGSIESSATAPEVAAGLNGSGQSTIDTVTGEPSVMRRIARPHARTPSRSGSGTR